MSIKFNDVSFVYSPRTPFETAALNNINLTIERGSYTAVVGHTGSGKSTLVQEINALYLPTSGTLTVEDFVIQSRMKSKEIKKLRQKVGMVFQFAEYQLFEDTVEKDAAFAPKNFGSTDEEAIKKAHEALTRVGLDKSFYKRSPFELSGGQKRRVAIAGIIASNPDILILDEPTVGLDPKGLSEMMHLFDEIHKWGTTIILVTHDMNLVLKYADDVIVMKEGKVVEHCSPTELFSNIHYEEYSLDLPYVFYIAKLLEDGGMELNKANIKDMKSLAHEVALAKKVVSHNE